MVSVKIQTARLQVALHAVRVPPLGHLQITARVYCRLLLQTALQPAFLAAALAQFQEKTDLAVEVEEEFQVIGMPRVIF
jgi:hypothetical protein